MIAKWSWGIALVLAGVIVLGFTSKLVLLALGISLIVAGVASITGK